MGVVYCQVLKREAAALDWSPYPGPLGQRICASVSQEGWQLWLERLAAIINENRLNTADPAHLALIEKHMCGFLFGEGDFGQLPGGFTTGPGRSS